MKSSAFAIAATSFLAILSAGCAAKSGTPDASGTSVLSATMAVDSQGNCTQTFVSAYNSVIEQATAAEADATLSQLQAIDSACAVLAEPITCRALVNSSAAEVSTENLTSVCTASTNATSSSTSSPTSIPISVSTGNASTGVISVGTTGTTNTTTATETATALKDAAIPSTIAIDTTSSAASDICTPSFVSSYNTLSSMLAQLSHSTTSLTAEQISQAGQTCENFVASLAGKQIVCSQSSSATISSETLVAQCARYE